MSKSERRSPRTKAKAGAGAKAGAAKPRTRASKAGGGKASALPRATRGAGATAAARAKREAGPKPAPGSKREATAKRDPGATRTPREKRETGDTRAAKSAPAPRAGRPKLPADVKAALAAALDKKAIDPILLDLRQASAFTDFFLIFTGANTRQVQAIADSVEDTLRKQGTRPALVEGSRRAEWILIDYFDFIVHVFTPVTREFYALERLWGDGERIEISSL